MFHLKIADIDVLIRNISVAFRMYQISEISTSFIQFHPLSAVDVQYFSIKTTECIKA